MINNTNKLNGNGKVSNITSLSLPDPEVIERPKRRKYSAEYKLRILKEAEAMTPGNLGALLRREGIYASNIAMWRWQREKGELEGLRPKKKGRKETLTEDLKKKLDELERENRHLKKRLSHAELIIDVQKKISELSWIPLKEVTFDEKE